MVPTLYAADAATAAAAGGFYNQTAFVPQLAVTQMPQVYAAPNHHTYTTLHFWLRGTVVERRSLASELSLSCARPAADG